MDAAHPSAIHSPLPGRDPDGNAPAPRRLVMRNTPHEARTRGRCQRDLPPSPSCAREAPVAALPTTPLVTHSPFVRTMVNAPQGWATAGPPLPNPPPLQPASADPPLPPGPAARPCRPQPPISPSKTRSPGTPLSPQRRSLSNLGPAQKRVSVPGRLAPTLQRRTLTVAVAYARSGHACRMSLCPATPLHHPMNASYPALQLPYPLSRLPPRDFRRS